MKKGNLLHESHRSPDGLTKKDKKAEQPENIRTALLLTIPASLCFATRSRSPLLSLVHRLKSLKTNLIKFHTLKNAFHFLISISIISSYFLRNTLSSSIHPHTELSKVQYGNFGLFVKKAIKYDFVSLIKTESII